MFGLPRPAEWMQEALCQEVDPDLFYAERGDAAQVDRAKQVCRRCPVVVECLEHAVKTGEVHGVWGGLAPQERVEWRQRRGMTRKGLSLDDWHGSAGGYRKHYREGTKVCQACREAERVARANRRCRCG